MTLIARITADERQKEHWKRCSFFYWMLVCGDAGRHVQHSSREDFLSGILPVFI
jgi:hypothetical protein